MNGANDALTSPSPWVARFAGAIRRGGRVLDLACGSGRHVRYLRQLGLAVVAVDRDTVGVADLVGLAGVEVIALDLEDGRPWSLGDRFDAIIVTNYLHRPLFGSITAALAQGGLLLYETFARGNEQYGRPCNPAFLLKPGELLAAFGPELQTVAFEQGVVERPKLAVVQRLAAVKSTHPVALQDGTGR